MIRSIWFLVWVVSSTELVACKNKSFDSDSSSNNLSRPNEAVVLVNCPTLAGLTASDLDILVRHFSSSLAWEVRQERFVGPDRVFQYAIRIERSRGGPFAPKAGEYYISLNGFYSDFNSPDVTQTRVLIGLNREHGFGMERGNVTRTRATAGPVQLILEKYMDQPGLQSYLIVEGGAGLTLEIFEQSHVVERKFTNKVLQEFESEIRSVLQARQEIKDKGYAEALIPDGSVQEGQPSIKVEDGMQGGIYIVTAWINSCEPGSVYLKVFYEGPDTKNDPQSLKVPPELNGKIGTQLSENRMKNPTTRYTGWSVDPKKLFRYQSEAVVYEGDWQHLYQARFELWFKTRHGLERKIIATSRTICGWQR